jgi:hypothetical protein
MKFFVSHCGDGSVGLPGESATVDIDVESYAVEIRDDYIDQVRDTLAGAFRRLWDMPVRVGVVGAVEQHVVGAEIAPDNTISCGNCQA